MENGQFNTRLRCVIALYAAILIGFSWVLYDLQIKNGESYLEQSSRKIVKVETVEAARGEILDRYGRVLVSNRLSYDVSLDVSILGTNINETIASLLDICRDRDISWTDTFPMEATFPFSLAEEVPAIYTKFLLREKLSDNDGGRVLLKDLREFYKIDDSYSDAEARGIIGIRYELTLRTRELTYNDYTFTHDVDIDFITTVKEMGLYGVNINPVTVRQYHTEYAAHLLGRVGLMSADEWNYIYKDLAYPYNASVGKDGVEKAFESYLHGESGVRAVETNTQGKIVSEYWVPNSEGVSQVPQPGENVMLTLDIELQGAVEQALENRITQLASTEKEGGAAVVIDVKDGGVLALASYPTFDITTYAQNYAELAQDPLNPMFNRATQGIYSPGSTYKMVTTLAGLAEGIISPDTVIRCSGRYQYYSDYQPQCWIYRQGGTHGNETIADAICDSCNIFMYDTGRRLGVTKLEEYARLFGLGEYTGLELTESKGIVAGPTYTESLGQTWNEGSVLSAAIGQENNQFTPIQLANYIATVANGGTRYSTHLLKEVKANDYSAVLEVYEPDVLYQFEFEEEGLEQVKLGMLRVTQSGASYYAGFQDVDVDVAAKTGSAQISGSSGSNALYVCFAPYDDPEIAIALVVEKGGSGSVLAGLASDIVSYYFSVGSNMQSVELENTMLR